ncbi:MAG: DEAD/DEAH box helicase family protein [Gammaproteobacteria bacterium]|nr:DEAD/DEAH box helicase family protein [Gammaproteobacteria bacterium]
MTNTLAEEYDTLDKHGHLNGDLPINISSNLAPSIKLRPYQISALKRWLYHIDKNHNASSNPHLLFHMATGSGKTVLMAALILDLYKRGYRNFLFFVNSAQIIAKTRENFLNQASAKYLFAPHIRIDDKPVDIRAVEIFDAASKDAINIHFTTIQGLHSRIHHPKEDSVTLEDFCDQKVVLISDEAHHLNAETKSNPNQNEKKAVISWEGTVQQIFGQHNENILLEFTATADMGHEAIREKYKDKILYDYPLRKFREDKYSKDIELREADLPPHKRMMQAMILSQYRRKVASAYGIHCKPVILMKSKTIAESSDNEMQFVKMVEELSGETLQDIRAASTKDTMLSRAFNYMINDNDMDAFDNLVRELKGDFSNDKVVNVNKLEDLEKRQIELNSLEDYSNEVRVIFAVDKLNEGWDVLNLFDIVRLYNTRDSSSKGIGKTTMSEAQLIGRGARYFPFPPPPPSDNADGASNLRKYDSDPSHPLRILEELYYHCYHNPRYIDDIKRALRETGMLDETTREVHLRLKKSFKESSLYKSGYVWTNKQIKNQRENIFGLDGYSILQQFEYPTHVMTGHVANISAFIDQQPTIEQKRIGLTSHDFYVKDFGSSILNFAMDSNAFFHFTTLKKHFPNLTGVREFQTSPQYLGGVSVSVRGLKEHLENLTLPQKLDIVQYVLRGIEDEMMNKSKDHIGTKNFYPCKIDKCFKDKILKLRIEGEAGLSWPDTQIDELRLYDPLHEDWHAYDNNYGTDQEKYFVRFLCEQTEVLKELYDDFYLLRNEKAVKLFAFADGQAFEPDFVLFLRRKNARGWNTFQLFVEPKGKNLMQNDKWKEDFLMGISGNAELAAIFENSDYALYGLPFFNEQQKFTFKKAFQEIIENHEDEKQDQSSSVLE